MAPPTPTPCCLQVPERSQQCSIKIVCMWTRRLIGLRNLTITNRKSAGGFRPGGKTNQSFQLEVEQKHKGQLRAGSPKNPYMSNALSNAYKKSRKAEMHKKAKKQKSRDAGQAKKADKQRSTNAKKSRDAGQAKKQTSKEAQMQKKKKQRSGKSKKAEEAGKAQQT